MTQADSRLIEAFTLMWGAYPGPASLVHRSRTIIAVNEPCRLGGRKPGMNCAKWDSPEKHKGCLANQALNEQKPLCKVVRNERGVGRVYWLPVSEYPDYYVHFTTEIMATSACSPESSE